VARTIYVLRALDLPIEVVREVLEGSVSQRAVIEAHRDQTALRTRVLNEIAAAVEVDDHATISRYVSDFTQIEGAAMSQQTTSRPVQITIHADDLAEAVTFYSEVFGGEYHEETSSFVFGTWKTDSFFRLCIEPQWPNGHHPGRNTCFSFLVDDVDSIHRRAIAAGATEVHPPRDYDWKPRTSIVDDPSGNRIALAQA
jgi:predicted enzyme related to lactoylglutathione lyase